MPINYKKYPSNWLSEIRPRIMERANNTCEGEGCNFKHLEEAYSIQNKGETYWFRMFDIIPMDWFKTYRFVNDKGVICLELRNLKRVKVVLTIAHLDHDEHNHNVKDERLAAMCQKCHLAYDKEEKAKRRLIKIELNIEL